MKNEKLKMRKRRHKSLYKGKKSKLKFTEKIELKIAGSIDGRRGLPKEDVDGVWKASFSNREINGYNEFCVKSWGSLQIEMEEKYAALEKIIDEANKLEIDLFEARHALENLENAAYDFNFRKKGENKLTDPQVVSRRKAERARMIAPHKSKVAKTEEDMKALLERLYEQYGEIEENVNSTHMICERLKTHCMMRLDAYWNASYHKHPDQAKMPPVAMFDLENNAESEFLKPHEALMKRAMMILQANVVEFKTEMKEVA